MNHYETLGVPREASQAEIESAFERRKQVGPSKETFRAYWWLSDPERRKQYDETLAGKTQAKQQLQRLIESEPGGAFSNEEFQSWLSQGGITQGIAAKIASERAEAEREARAVRELEHKRQAHRERLVGALKFLVLAVISVGILVGAIWFVLTVIHYFWTHPLF